MKVTNCCMNCFRWLISLIPSVFANVHPKFKTPWVNTILVGLLAMGFAGFMGLDALANLTNVGTLAAFSSPAKRTSPPSGSMLASDAKLRNASRSGVLSLAVVL